MTSRFERPHFTERVSPVIHFVLGEAVWKLSSKRSRAECTCNVGDDLLRISLLLDADLNPVLSELFRPLCRLRRLVLPFDRGSTTSM